MQEINVGIQVLKEGCLPIYKHEGDTCADCYANTNTEIKLEAWGKVTVPLGFKLDLPNGFQAVINPRSGLASRDGIMAVLGKIDNGFKGELGCTLFNHTNSDFYIKPMDRICQLEILPVYKAVFYNVDNVGTSDRGEGAFGSTGIN